MAQKSHFIVKALPASDLESLLTMLKRSKKQQIELTVRAPTLSLKQVPNKFMNGLTSLTHLKGLDISALDLLPDAALTKLVRMTNLEQLTLGPSYQILSPLSNLTKLVLRNVTSSPQTWQSLTNLQDLTLNELSTFDKFLNFIKLTRLHFGMPWNAVEFNIALTTLTNLKDLKIESRYQSNIGISANFSAASTRLEALDIDVMFNDIDINWIASNTRLTRFHVRCDYKLSERFFPLTKLCNISSMTIFNTDQLQLFTALENLTHLKANYLFNNDFEIAQEKFTLLQSLEGGGYQTRDFPNTFSNLTKITWMPVMTVTTVFPLNVRELTANHFIKNMTSLTKLESLTVIKPQVLDIDVRNMIHLTKICLQSVEAQQALWILPKLSNLFSLRELSVTTPNNYQGLNADFLCTLTNLEALSIPSLNIDCYFFNYIVAVHNQLTQLRINCSESTGEILTRLTNLQVLEFYSSKPMKGLKIMLEEKLPRLTMEVRVN